jgi:hypothetical protein
VDFIDESEQPGDNNELGTAIDQQPRRRRKRWRVVHDDSKSLGNKQHAYVV